MRGKLRTRNEYQYDDKEARRILESDCYTSKNTLNYKQIFSYNQAGLLIRSKAYDKKGKLIAGWKYEYTSYP